MKSFNIKSLITIVIMSGLTACSADFIEDKKDYSSVGIGIYQDESLAEGYVNQVYGLMLPDGNVNMAMYSKTAHEHSSGNLFSQASDEVDGQNDLNQQWGQIAITNAHCLKSIGRPLTSSAGRNDAWTRIRYCNSYINNVDDYSGLDEDFKNQILGQLYFWRAWQYFELVRLYGGVPLVLVDQGTNIYDPSNQTPRSSSSEVINQIVADLDMSKNLLEQGRAYTEDDRGRITAEAALALKGRVLLTWASPLFNRSDDTSRWQRSYEANLEAYNACLAAGKGLNPDWQGMWFQDYNMESIMSFGFNSDNTQSEISKNNHTEYQSRSIEQGGNGGVSPTKNVMDAFPMSDGTPYNPSGDLNDFYKNRDPRFYMTFAYNGAQWGYDEDPNFVNWTYFWNAQAGSDVPSRSTETNPNDTGFYLSKFTNPDSSSDNNFRNSGADYMEIRFAEVVLNLAESAIGIGNLQEGKQFIQTIRERAGVENLDGQYGLSSVSSRDQHFAAVINERKVEFAYENKRFHDLRRWLLYNDTNGTCTRLNQTPIHGSRRQGYYIVAMNGDGTEYVGSVDPFLGPDAPVVDRDSVSLDDMYDTYFKVVVRDNVDPNQETWTFTWYNEYYFFGIYQDVWETAPYLEQTQGWGGSFNPLN